VSLFDLVLGALLLLSGYLAVTSKNAVYAAVALAANFVLLGAVYMLLDARYLGWMQIAIYAGAVMVLFVFVIMLLGAREPEPQSDPLPELRRVAYLVAGAGFLALAYAFMGLTAPLKPETAGLALEGGTARALAPVLWQGWLYPVLLVAALLLVATVAAVALIRPGKGGGR